MRLSVIVLITLLFFCSDFVFGQTHFGKGTDQYGVFLNSLKKQLTESEYRKTLHFGGKRRNQFVQWIRDNVHVMKAMKYMEPEISSFWEFFMENQTKEGLYFDYYYPIAEPVNHRMNLFEKRYWKILSRDSIQMHRLPVEADLEYLMVEGAYYIWQSTGDDNYIKKWLPNLEKGLNYIMTDPLRWSARFQLAKRGYTLDTWDFMQLPTSREEYKKQGFDVQNGIFNIDEKTPMGIMHGDNSGLYAACMQLSAIYSASNNQDKVNFWKEKGEAIRQWANQLCWNGEYYAHFIEDDPSPAYLKIDHRHTLSLSNPYDINRGLPTQEMAQSIIANYQKLKGNNVENAFAEWFGVYPPVEPDFAGYKPGSYMNGGVNTIVGGELAKAAFQHGYEQYGVDILERMIELNTKHGDKLPVSYTPEGKVDAGIPDNWGQAAIMSAMIEGLAGVIDKGQLFDKVEIAPRWLAAGKNTAEVRVEYGPTKKNVSYTFNHDMKAKTINLMLAGSPSNYAIKLLLPDYKQIKSVKINKKTVAFSIDKVRNSQYLVLMDIMDITPLIEVRYK
ncbi:hypothetical protein [Emticicia agri]|uniref:Alpha-L-rhamnosidase six-hairpin glycosidase domain-containing protein n=1 Tax=Emticicia agri TaxID=2492393 RepID=A0A4Q5M0R9_9BACT|nr:hypothetical protein [Emticicia agri]RYU95794.1 hypothetical protein EWM59_10565 [Emticicia agri]